MYNILFCTLLSIIYCHKTKKNRCDIEVSIIFLLLHIISISLLSVNIEQ
jgi:hypothetical protein